MSESNDYKTLKANLLQPGDRLDRVENVVLDGMFDCNYCALGVESWIELKSPTEPKRSTTHLFGSNHKLSQAQMNWAKRQCDAAGRSWVIIATNKRWMLVHGLYADEINNMTVEELLAISVWNTTKPVRDKEKWTTLRRILTVY